MRPWGQGEVLGHSHSIFDDWSSPGTVHGSLRYRILFRCRESFTLALLFRFIFGLHDAVSAASLSPFLFGRFAVHQLCCII